MAANKAPNAPAARAATRNRRTINWKATPFAAFKEKSCTPLAVAESQESLKELLSKLPPSSLKNVYFAEMKNVQLKVVVEF